MNVRLYEADLFGLILYRVFVDDKLYDKFTSEKYLTYTEQRDVESYYTEALDNYTPPMLELSEYEKTRRHL